MLLPALFINPLPTTLHAASAASATLSGRLTDDHGQPVVDAQVTLANLSQNFRQTTRSDARGRFRIFNLPFNKYHLEVEAAGLQPVHQDVELRTTLPVDLGLVLRPAGAEVAVEESATLVEDHPSTHVDINRSVIEKIPAAVQSRAMEAVLLTTPGFVQDENGRFHFRGSHGQVTYVIDGIPISDQVQATFSNSLDPGQADSLEVITGGISAEFGGKPVAVVNMTTKSGLGAQGRQGEVFLGASRFSTYEAGFSVREGLGNFGYFVNGSASASDRFLDPVVWENFHNHGSTGRMSGRFDWLLSDQDTLRFSLSGGRSSREGVNLPSQQAAGQDQRMVTGDANASLAWTHLFAPDRSLDASIYYRRATSDLKPSADPGAGFPADPRDFPVWVSQQRTLENQGAQAAYTLRFPGGSTLKAGLQVVAFPLTERFRFAITDPEAVQDPDEALYAFTPAGGSVFRFEERLRPLLASAYLQNDLHLGRWFLAAGLRLDRYSVRDLVHTELQPRLGLSYTVAPGTILRASYDRLMITPENENLALTTSAQAWALGPGAGSPVPQLKPELQDSTSYGVEQQVGKALRVTVEYWEKRSRNAADNEQFLNTGILFPIAADRGLFRGMNARVELLPFHGFSGTLNLGKTRAIFQAPTVGGLRLEPSEHAPGERFLIDHDQKLAVQLGVKYEQKGFYLQVSGRYDSGLVAGDPAEAAGNPDLAFGIPFVRKDSEGTWRVRPRTIWDLSAGQAFSLKEGRSLLISLDLLNALNEKALYNFLSVFGGTHVVPPRTLAARIKYRF